MIPEPAADYRPDPKEVIVQVRIENGRVRVRPERVRVGLGQVLRWLVDFNDHDRLLQVTIYFNESSPFGWTSATMLAIPDPEQFGRVYSTRARPPSVSGTPETPGDYKYGIRIATRKGGVLDDDDPYISVVSRL